MSADNVRVGDNQPIGMPDRSGAHATPAIGDLEKALPDTQSHIGQIVVKLLNDWVHADLARYSRSPMVTLMSISWPPRTARTDVDLPTRSLLSSISSSSIVWTL